MNDSPVTIIETSKGKIFQMIVVNQKPAKQKTGQLMHFTGFSLPTSDGMQEKISITGIEINKIY